MEKIVYSEILNGWYIPSEYGTESAIGIITTLKTQLQAFCEKYKVEEKDVNVVSIYNYSMCYYESDTPSIEYYLKYEAWVPGTTSTE